MRMNVFRLIGDLLHLQAMSILLWNIWDKRSCAGISGRTQILFAIVFTARYLDVVTVFIGAYITLVKLVFLLITYVTVYFIYRTFRDTYDSYHDTFKIYYLIIPALILACFVNYEFTFIEVMWAFSEYLEAVAILPQLYLIHKTEEVSKFTTWYLLSLGCYRLFYVFNWIYKYMDESAVDIISVCSGSVQTILYIDFVYLCVTRVREERLMVELVV